MRFPNRLIIDEVAALGMPSPEESVITHGGALVVWGIRPEHEDGDIDIATSLENNQFVERELGFRAMRMIVGIQADGSEQTVIARRDLKGRFDMHRWDFSPKRYQQTGKGRLYLPELYLRSIQDEHTGIWVALPELVRETKQGSGRAKDRLDIELVDTFLDT